MGLFGFESRKERRTKHTDVDKLREELAAAEASVKYWRDRCAADSGLTPDEIDVLKNHNIDLAARNTALREQNESLSGVVREQRERIAGACALINDAAAEARTRGQPSLVRWLQELASTLQND